MRPSYSPRLGLDHNHLSKEKKQMEAFHMQTFTALDWCNLGVRFQKELERALIETFAVI